MLTEKQIVTLNNYLACWLMQKPFTNNSIIQALKWILWSVLFIWAAHHMLCMHAGFFSVFSTVNQWKMKRVPRCSADKKKAKAILLLHFPSRGFKVSDY